MFKTKGFVVTHTWFEVLILAHFSCVILGNSLIFWISLSSIYKTEKKFLPHHAFAMSSHMKRKQNLSTVSGMGDELNSVN